MVKEEWWGDEESNEDTRLVGFIRTRSGRVRNDERSDGVGEQPGLGVRGPYRASYKCSHAVLSFQARVSTLAENPPSMVTSA